ncbi:hypothetical protein ACF071_10725 [Streptomyces albidoflavus]
MLAGLVFRAIGFTRAATLCVIPAWSVGGRSLPLKQCGTSLGRRAMAERWTERLTARNSTADEWNTFCDGLRALTVDDADADDLTVGLLSLFIRRWADWNGRHFRASPAVMRDLLRQAGYEVHNRSVVSPSGKTQSRRYVRGLQLR